MDTYSENNSFFRHGDLLIRRIDKIPKQCQRIDSSILAMGEKTGHHHKLEGLFQIYENPSKIKFLETFETVNLTHQEHVSIFIPKGTYVVVNERQFDPFADIKVTRVLD